MVKTLTLKLVQHKEVRIRKGNFSMNTNTDEKKFIDKYGYDALKIIAAFEEAFERQIQKSYSVASESVSIELILKLHICQINAIIYSGNVIMPSSLTPMLPSTNLYP